MNVNYDKYIKVCRDALRSDEIFNNFRSHRDYTDIVEIVWYELGLEYYEAIKKQFPYLLNHISRFSEGDNIGGPVQYPFNGVILSPTTMRYIKTLADLIDCFGRLDGMDIVEVGVGYGGQCKIIQQFSEPASYTLVDLPEALTLAEKWLLSNNISNFILRSSDESSRIHYNLFISNYAFSEFNRRDQDHYADNIIKHSDSGYMLCNYFNIGGQRMSKKDIFDLKPNHQVLPEIPLSAPDNLVYIWRP